jgi:hypothetical protein
MNIGLAVVSLALAVGWAWYKTRLVGANQQNLEEHWLVATARFFYFVGLPYLAIISGILSLRWLGLKGLDYFAFSSLTGDFGTETQKAITLLLWEGLVDGSVMIGPGLLALLAVGGLRLGLTQAGLNLAAGLHSSPGTIFYTGLHWAFYRAIFWQVSGDLYLGTVLGAVWVMLEWALLAWLQQDRLAQQRQFWANLILLVLTSTLFYFSPNLGLLWLFHWAMVVIFSCGWSMQITMTMRR